jgi:hypothetical protein
MDRDSKGRLQQYYTQEFPLVKRDGEGGFVAAGESDSDASILPTPFTAGTIDFTFTDSPCIPLQQVTKIEVVVHTRGRVLQGMTE